jgi:hypothetical protein
VRFDANGVAHCVIHCLVDRTCLDSDGSLSSPDCKHCRQPSGRANRSGTRLWLGNRFGLLGVVMLRNAPMWPGVGVPAWGCQPRLTLATPVLPTDSEGPGPRCDPGPTCANSPAVRPEGSRRRHRSRSGRAISTHWWKFSTVRSLDRNEQIARRQFHRRDVVRP